MIVNGNKWRRIDFNNVSDLMIASDRDLDGTINFSEYLLMRRSIISWMQCAQQFMNRAGLRCALSIAVPGRDLAQAEADTIFHLGTRIMRDE